MNILTPKLGELNAMKSSELNPHLEKQYAKDKIAETSLNKEHIFHSTLQQRHT